VRLLVAALLTITLAALLAQPAQAASANLVISQVYGGGGNTGAPYTHDYIEIFNRSDSRDLPEGRRAALRQGSRRQRRL
jgi:hypothetical protein